MYKTNCLKILFHIETVRRAKTVYQKGSAAGDYVNKFSIILFLLSLFIGLGLFLSFDYSIFSG